MPPKSKRPIKEMKNSDSDSSDEEPITKKEEPKKEEPKKEEPTDFIEDAFDVGEGEQDVMNEPEYHRRDFAEIRRIREEKRRRDIDEAKKTEDTITGNLTTNQLLKILMFRGKSSANPTLFNGARDLFNTMNFIGRRREDIVGRRGRPRGGRMPRGGFTRRDED